VHRGALASLHRPQLPAVETVIAGARRIVVLEDIVDHTNVGAILRSAAGLGIEGALLSPRCADPLYRRSVKVAMGAVFSLPWTRLPEWYDGLPKVAADGFVTVALTPTVEAEPLPSVAERLRGKRVAIVVGSEGPGISDRWLDSAAMRARIPMQAGVDSLNVAAATAVACYALSAAESTSGSVVGDTGQSAG
jgi:tRNA G18 (ribose-2'-O)-methylase SpoU